ncbi:MAG TPA: class I SAM-dependent methyltransferase, partial [Thermoplasmata archaeon]|nr:class I SAM-dependent methyltransferase [Thermoplasmata archaeon]
MGPGGQDRVLLDLSGVALRYVREHWSERSEDPTPSLVRGDARRLPFRPRSFDVVVVLGNTLGFAGPEAFGILSECLEKLSDGGTILVESVAGPGERSNYLSRLPPGAVGRLLSAPVGPVQSRIEREGFRRLPERGGMHHGFERLSEAGILASFREHSVELVESIAVAPLLGGDPQRASEVARGARGWAHLL